MATAAVALRAADARDIDAVDAVMAHAFDPAFGEAWTRNQCLGVLALAGVGLILAELDDEPAGFAMTRRIADESELLLLAVASPFRRRGVGAALLRAAIAQARAEGCLKLHLEVRAGNPAARLYAGHGFGKVGERRCYYKGAGGAFHDAHSYSLRLDRSY